MVVKDGNALLPSPERKGQGSGSGLERAGMFNTASREYDYDTKVAPLHFYYHLHLIRGLYDVDLSLFWSFMATMIGNLLRQPQGKSHGLIISHYR